MIERVTDLQARVSSARAALEGLAERAARLRVRLQSPESSTPTARPTSVGPAQPPRTSFVSSEGESALPAESSALASSLDKLTKAAWITGASANEGDDGRFVSDAWEIALISEEGK